MAISVQASSSLKFYWDPKVPVQYLSEDDGSRNNCDQSCIAVTTDSLFSIDCDLYLVMVSVMILAYLFDDIVKDATIGVVRIVLVERGFGLAGG
ncbi:hypothetical protein ColLi_12714 [Colletotrichum liriopes]|uniref:Uncharacterized protein n=1 Tax=Colletotrichum liriopes TaxID=708192 RepID=A0AA37LZT0_9PEZI|nr:hypothetical protein ColLi_12714 [Colletotrichum liriopes]